MNFNAYEYTRVHSYTRMTASNLVLCVCGNWRMNHAVECSVVADMSVSMCMCWSEFVAELEVSVNPQMLV